MSHMYSISNAKKYSLNNKVTKSRAKNLIAFNITQDLVLSMREMLKDFQKDAAKYIK
jgi:hypothetical protein